MCCRRGATQEGRKESKEAETRPRSCSAILFRFAVSTLVISLGQAWGRGGVVKESRIVYKSGKRKVNV